MFFRTFGFYVSSCILMSISIDRCLTVMRPVHVRWADRRGRVLRAASWIFSAAASAPQVRTTAPTKGK